MATGNQPHVSVIVPVYEHIAELRACLKALSQQTLDLPFEVIVVDDGSPVPVALEPIEGLDVAVVRREHETSYAARNAGVARARGAVLAFTDADTLPETDWLERAISRLADTDGSGVVAGRVVVTVRAHPSGTELYELMNAFPQEFYVSKRHFGVTANLVMERRTFDRVGPFDETLTSGGDQEWGVRAWRMGVPMVYASDVVVHHPARTSLRALLRKFRRTSRGTAELRARGVRTDRDDLGHLATSVLPPVRTTLRLGEKDPVFEPLSSRLRYLVVRSIAHFALFLLAVRHRRPA